MIRYLDAFSDFNPLEDEISESLRWEIGYVVQHAKWLIPEDFTIEDLNAGLEILFQIKRHKYHESNKLLDSLPEEAQKQGLHTTPPFNYYLCIKYLEQGERPNGKPYLWSELFAVLALASVADYVYLSNRSVYEYQPGDDDDLTLMINNSGINEQSNKSGLKLEAIEALGYARLLAEREAVLGKIKKKGEKRGKKISKTKLQNYQDVKLAIVTHFNQLESELSARQAAKKIFADLSETLRLKLVGDNPTQQIEKWLGQYKSGSLPGQDKLPPYSP